MARYVKIVEVDPSIKKLVDENDGYCPCLVGHEKENKCICAMFRAQSIGKCLCGRYEKIVEETDE